MCAAADITFSLLTSGFILSPSVFFPWIQFILSVQFVLRLVDRSWLATVRDISSDMHHVINPSRPSPSFSYCKQQKLGVEAWEWGYFNMFQHHWLVNTSFTLWILVLGNKLHIFCTIYAHWRVFRWIIQLLNWLFTWQFSRIYFI